MTIPAPVVLILVITCIEFEDMRHFEIVLKENPLQHSRGRSEKRDQQREDAKNQALQSDIYTRAMLIPATYPALFKLDFGATDG